LLGSPITEQNLKRIGFSELSKSFTVKVFNCVKLLNDTYVSDCHNAEDYIFNIKSFDDLDYALSKIKPDYAIDFMGIGLWTIDVCRVLKKYNIHLVIQRTGPLPSPDIFLKYCYFLKLILQKLKRKFRQKIISEQTKIFKKYSIKETSAFNKINFFSYLEAVYQMPVVIAGYPNNINMNDFSDKMGGRKCVFNNTASLAANAYFAIVHCSTVISFAVLARMPIMHITTPEIQSSRYGLMVCAMAEELGAKLIDIDNEFLPVENMRLEINEAKYSEYENGFLKSRLSSEKAPWQAFTSHIENITIRYEDG